MSTQSNRERLVGRWELIETKRRFADTGEAVDTMGPAPRGTIAVSPDGYVSVLITAGDRDPNSSDTELFRTVMAYCGPCTLDDERFVTHVELAWHPSWVGTDQERFYTIDGDVLRIVGAEQVHPAYPGRRGRGELTWRRAR